MGYYDEPVLLGKGWAALLLKVGKANQQPAEPTVSAGLQGKVNRITKAYKGALGAEGKGAAAVEGWANLRYTRQGKALAEGRGEEGQGYTRITRTKPNQGRVIRLHRLVSEGMGKEGAGWSR